MIKTKQIKAGILGIIFTILGLLVRLFARDIAWPKEYSFSGPRENTLWAIREAAYRDIGLAFLIFGLMVMLAIVIHWLWVPFPNREN